MRASTYLAHFAVFGIYETNAIVGSLPPVNATVVNIHGLNKYRDVRVGATGVSIRVKH